LPHKLFRRIDKRLERMYSTLRPAQQGLPIAQQPMPRALTRIPLRPRVRVSVNSG